MRLLLVSIAAVAALAMACFAPVTSACPFCSAPSLTFAEQLAAAQAGILVQWVDGKKANRDEGFIGNTTYEVLQVVRDETSKLKKGEKIELERFRAGNKGELFLLFGTVTEDRIEWSSPLEVTEMSFNYIVQAPSQESPTKDRLEYFLKFLEYPDEMVSTDAYSEFANAPYDDIVPLADKMPRDKLISWLSDANVTPTRIGLYGLMMGLCGKPEDADFLKGIVLKDTDEFRLGIDGVMAGYLLLTGADGLKTINESKLTNTNVPFSETFAAMQALRFMWTYGKGRIPADDLRASMRLLLDRPDLADLVIVDLARWNDWSVMDRLMSMYTDKNYSVPATKRAIIRFMLIAEKDVPKDGQKLLTNDHVAQAKKNLEHLREVDPATVKAAERYFFD